MPPPEKRTAGSPLYEALVTLSRAHPAGLPPAAREGCSAAGRAGLAAEAPPLFRPSAGVLVSVIAVSPPQRSTRDDYTMPGRSPGSSLDPGVRTDRALRPAGSARASSARPLGAPRSPARR